MTNLRFLKKVIKGANMNGCSALPAMKNQAPTNFDTNIDEDDELFIGYGRLSNILPYQMQDKYDRAEDEIEFNVAILENDYLKATFCIDMGGKLWSLYDKVNNKDLITNNPVFRPCNLALRNAWLCGGVEWNIGMIGHSPLTCSPLFASKLTMIDGTPVLRLYEYERIRKVTYQMDFFLPSDSKFLFSRVRIVNPNKEVTPMYWWSNIAVPQNEGSRVIVPADDTFNVDYSDDNVRLMRKIPVPKGLNNFDITYPTNNPVAIDYFFNIPKNTRKFETQLDKDGYGLIQTSTDRQQGRKLFVWGQGQGGKHWQEFLTSEDGHPYQEMQAGVAKTQTECLPMPPKTAWEWIEAYGAMQIEAQKAHGDWNTAVKTVSDRLEELLPREKMDELLKSTKDDFVFKKGKIIHSGSGWGALENERRKHVGLPPISEHLDFGSIQDEQEKWQYLLDNGKLPKMGSTDEPKSYMIQDEWFDILKNATQNEDIDNFEAWLHLGICYYYRDDFEKAETCFNKSLELDYNVWALYCLANTKFEMNDTKCAIDLMLKASLMRPFDSSLAKETLILLSKNKEYEKMTELIDKLDESIKNGKIEYFHADALAHLGKLNEAEEILSKNGGLVIPDMREGETTTSELWIYIQTQKAEQNGEILNPKDVKVPYALDFRMNVANNDD